MKNYYNPVPKNLILKEKLNLPSSLGEFGSLKFIEEKLNKNKTINPENCFLPDYPYFNYIPSVVDYISSSTEFLTSYTPYQAEASQGLLQALFEYQSLICELTGMDIANASMYDHSTALCEALLMAVKYTERKKVLIPYYMRKERKQVIYTYLNPKNVEIYEYKVDKNSGYISLEDIEENVKNSAALYVENPNYFGVIDTNALKASKIIQDNGGLYIVGIDLISLGILKEPASYGADIAVGEAQSLAIYPYYGGPSLGILACKNDMKLIRLLPGRIVGATTTMDETELGYVLALQTREQHVKREKATSNICTNESWLAIRAAIFLSLYGEKGLKKLAAKIFLNTKLLIEELSKIKEVKVPYFDSVHFRSFISYFNMDLQKLHKKLLNKGILFGTKLESKFSEFKNCLLIGVNEFINKESIKKVCNIIKEVL